MIHHLHRTQQLNCNLSTAWKFFSSPYNLKKITPKDMNFRVTNNVPEEEIYEGLTIEYTVAPLLGIPLFWRTKIIEVAEQKSFTDLQVKGPYKLWKHRHEFISNKDGVLMTDHLDYQLPLGFIGELVHTLFIKKRVHQIFDYRHRVLEELYNQKKK